VAEPLLEVVDLTVDYLTDVADVRAVNRVSLTVAPGEFLGIVGESGCGKSTLLFSVARLLSPPGEVAAGQVIFRGTDMLRLNRDELRHVRWRDYSVVMQSAMNALNPMKSIGAQFKDTLQAHGRLSAQEIRRRSEEVLGLVGIDAIHLASYSHQLSGGMRQRVTLALAIAGAPALLLADEPTTALDVTIQDQILSLLAELQEELGMAIVLVSHDLGVIAQCADRVLVMRAGEVLEAGTVGDVLDSPRHPYTAELLAAVPRMDAAPGGARNGG
jgi:peptide/nickel transport system ATP-binding protein